MTTASGVGPARSRCSTSWLDCATSAFQPSEWASAATVACPWPGGSSTRIRSDAVAGSDSDSPTTASGSTTRNSLPTPNSLLRLTSPPIRSTSWRTMDRPSPVPPKRRVVEASACVKGVNRRASTSGLMPMPVSRTTNCTSMRPSSRGAHSTVSCTPPRSVNLTALPSRLTRICRMRVMSPRSRCGTSVSAWMISSSGLLWVSGAIIWPNSRSSSAIWKGTSSSTTSPASILDRSSTSLIRPIRERLATCTLASRSACSASSRVWPSR